MARALAQKADLFLLDEPFVGIDVTSEEMIVKILKELRDEGKTIIVVHHDLSKAEKYFDELLLLNKELIANGQCERCIYSSNDCKSIWRPTIIFRRNGDVDMMNFIEAVMQYEFLQKALILL